MPSSNGHGPKTAVLYTRVSTDEQARSGYSLAQQIEALRDYAAGESYEVLEEVVDPGQSGASLERPGMDRVRDLVTEGGVSVVLAQDRDRFSREPAYSYLLGREFEVHGTALTARRSTPLTTVGTKAPRASSRMVSWTSSPSTSALKSRRGPVGGSSRRPARARS